MAEPNSSTTAEASQHADEPWNVVITKKQIGYASLVCFIAWVASVSPASFTRGPIARLEGGGC